MIIHKSNSLPLMCIGCFVVADTLLVRRTWILSDNQLLVVQALPLSQCALAAIWAVTSRVSICWRFAVPVLVSVASWYVMANLLQWGATNSNAWAMVLALQTIVIVLVVRGQRMLFRRFLQDDKRSRLLSYDLRTLMLWTTVIAVGFGCAEYGRNRMEWSIDVENWPYFAFMLGTGALSGLMAAMLCLAVRERRSWLARALKIASALLLTAAIGYGMCKMTESIWNDEIVFRQLQILLGVQAVLLLTSFSLLSIGTQNEEQAASTTG